MNDDLAATAYHETGHALVAYILGTGFKTVSIIPRDEENALGALTHLRDRSLIYNVLSGISNFILDHDTIDNLVKQSICIAFGGYLAEKKYGVDNKEGAQADFSFISDLILAHGPIDDDSTNTEDYSVEFHNYCYNKTKELLEDNWFILDFIAKQLILQKELTYEEFDILVKKALEKLKGRDMFFTN